MFTVEDTKSDQIQALKEQIREIMGEEGLHVVLTYRPSTPIDARAATFRATDFAQYMMGYFDGSYYPVCVIRTHRVPGHIHHHVLIRNVDLSVLQEAWPFGPIHCTRVEGAQEIENVAKRLIRGDICNE